MPAVHRGARVNRVAARAGFDDLPRPEQPSLRSRIDDVLRVVRTIIGVPDYDRYLKHVCERHPDVTPLTREEFELDRLKARYARPGNRCC